MVLWGSYLVHGYFSYVFVHHRLQSEVLRVVRDLDREEKSSLTQVRNGTWTRVDFYLVDSVGGNDFSSRYEREASILPLIRLVEDTRIDSVKVTGMVVPTVFSNHVRVYGVESYVVEVGPCLRNFFPYGVYLGGGSIISTFVYSVNGFFVYLDFRSGTWSTDDFFILTVPFS